MGAGGREDRRKDVCTMPRGSSLTADAQWLLPSLCLLLF